MSQIDISAKDSAPDSKRLPLWAKLIIIFMVLGFGLIVSFCVIAFAWIYPQFLNSGKPENIEKVTARFATFSPNPPPDFKFITGLDLFSMYTIAAEHLLDKECIFMVSYPFVQGDPSAVVDAVSSNNLQVPHAGTHFNSVTSKGELQVAHEKMPYVIGTMSDHGRVSEAMFGCLAVRKNNRTVCVFVFSPPGHSFSFKDAVTFLGSIEQFN